MRVKIRKIIRLVLDIPEDRPSSVMRNAKHKKWAVFRSLFVKNRHELLDNFPNVANGLISLHLAIFLVNILHISRGDMLAFPIFLGSFMGVARLIKCIKKMSENEMILSRDRYDPGLCSPLWSGIPVNLSPKGSKEI